MIIPFDRDEHDEWPVTGGIHCEYPWGLSEEGEEFLVPKTDKAVIHKGRTKNPLNYQQRRYLKKLKLSKDGP